MVHLTLPVNGTFLDLRDQFSTRVAGGHRPGGVIGMMHCRAMSAEQGGTTKVTYLGLAPYLYYANATEALDWLRRVFGFTEKVRYVDASGVVFQATVLAGDAEIQMAAVGSEYWQGKGVEGPVGQLNIIYVDDVDAQHERVCAALGEGADIPAPQDQPYGARVFTVPDIGGNSWTFWQQISDTVDLPAGWQEIRPE
jgi:uncharacterized glyoxalase superfamily protein PhnB